MNSTEEIEMLIEEWAAGKISTSYAMNRIRQLGEEPPERMRERGE